MNNQYIRGLRIQKQSAVKKLYAAVCMVLIAALLVSASSYAWFVLSQAPEVSNVTTNIGANGNLEIALGKNIAESAIGDSFNKNDVTIANRTWGNLINLTDESYGLQAITLRPAIMNSAGGAINMLHPLAYPIYGAEGRVQHIYANNMFAGTYNGSQFVTSTNDYGVHGIGTTQYHAPGVDGTFGPLSQRQEIFYNAQNSLWTMTASSYKSLCENSQTVLMAYCTDGTGVSASDFNLDVFSQRVADVVSAANEELRYIFTILAASETTSANNYFMAMDLLEQEYPDYETVRSLVGSAIQTENVGNIGTAIAELRAFQDTSNQLKDVIASGAINSTDGYSMNEIAQTVGLFFDLEKTSFTETSKDYWSKVIAHLHYRKYVNDKYWRWDYLDDNDFAVNDLTDKLSDSNGQDNDSREATVYEIEHTHTYSLYSSLPLEKLDLAIAGLYASHWMYWDNCSEEYQLLQAEIADLESQVKQLEDSGASESTILLKTMALSDKKACLQSLIDSEIYALDDDRVEAIQSVMADTIEAMRQYTLWTIAYCACDGRVPDDAYHHILEIASSTDYTHPRAAYQALCNYGVTPQAELANMVAAFEKLQTDLLFMQSVSNGTDVITWSELSKELQRIFGAIDHKIYFIDYRQDYSSSLSVEDTPFPIEVMGEILAEINKCEAAIGTVTKSNAKHRITYRYLDEENKHPWAQALGLLLTIYNTKYPFEYGTAEYTLTDQLFSTEHSMWYAQGFQLSISVGVGSEDNFNESGLTVRQTRFREAQENISYYQNQLITAAVNPGKDMAALLMQIIANDGSVSLVTISEYLDSLRQQLKYGETMMYQATLAMAASNYAEDYVYEYAYSNYAPEDAAGMIELLRNYNFDATVLSVFDQSMAQLNAQKVQLNQSLVLLNNYQNSETGALKIEQISVAEAVALLNPVLDTEGMTLYGYVAESDDSSRYVRTVLFTGYGSPSVHIYGNQAIVTGREPVTIFGNVYLSLDNSFSGGMLALAKSETESYASPTGGLSTNEIVAVENSSNRCSYTIGVGTELYTLNLRTADEPYSLATNLWTYTGNTEYISANQVLVDVYGYSIDLSFRTNADNSDLMLQTEAVDRIYDDGGQYTDTSMGAGSYMEFEILDPSYTPEIAKEYMSCLRMVLTDTNTGYIYGYAALDMTAAEVVGVTVKAPLRLYNKDTGLMIEGDTAQYICHLGKNLEKNLTVYVYLDGAKVTQSLATATHEKTLSGLMNIQFCSSADLKPAFSDDSVTDNGGSQTPMTFSNRSNT